MDCPLKPGTFGQSALLIVYGVQLWAPAHLGERQRTVLAELPDVRTGVRGGVTDRRKSVFGGSLTRDRMRPLGFIRRKERQRLPDWRAVCYRLTSLAIPCKFNLLISRRVASRPIPPTAVHQRSVVRDVRGGSASRNPPYTPAAKPVQGHVSGDSRVNP